MSLQHRASSVVQPALDELKKRRNPDGGFSLLLNNPSRPDVTAWALLALRSCGETGALVVEAGDYLKAYQQENGSVLMAEEESAAVWITYVAAWAWQGMPEFEVCAKKALNYILSISGNWSYINAWGMAHDQSLKGWPWVAGTSSWVDSTALALLALRSAGLEGHGRYVEGIKLLKNRELPSGGWNCGNTIVYGTELRPTPESTAMALTLLDIRNARHVSSVQLLRQYLRPATGPLTLAWGLMAIGTKKDLPVLEQVLVEQQRDYCQTEWLSLLCMAWSFLTLSQGANVLGFPREGRL